MRDQRQKELLEERVELAIIGFIVRDNGTGFTQENFDSFSLADSDFKRSLGAKGVGRFVWLKAFGEVKIRSYFENKGKYFRRTFIFKESRHGIHDHVVEEVFETNTQIGTEIHLAEFKEAFQRTCPKRTETIAAKIVTHLLILFSNQ